MEELYNLQKNSTSYDLYIVNESLTRVKSESALPARVKNCDHGDRVGAMLFRGWIGVGKRRPAQASSAK